MKIFALAFTFVLTFTLNFSDAYAAKSCYSKQEAEAEQGIRILNELMVIGLNCAHMADANGNNLYVEHQKFTTKHANLFQQYEKILLNNLKQSGEADPEASFHTLSTGFANKISNDVATMRPDIFCRTYSSRIEKAAVMNTEMIRRWAATPFKTHPVSKPACKE